MRGGMGFDGDEDPQGTAPDPGSTPGRSTILKKQWAGDAADGLRRRGTKELKRLLEDLFR